MPSTKSASSMVNFTGFVGPDQALEQALEPPNTAAYAITPRSSCRISCCPMIQVSKMIQYFCENIEPLSVGAGMAGIIDGRVEGMNYSVFKWR